VTSPLPAWSLEQDEPERLALPRLWPAVVDREWAWGGSTGAGVRVCVVDSGVDASHPRVGPVARAVAVTVAADGTVSVDDDEEGDSCGHGTACAGIIRSLAPDCELHSVRVLGASFKGSGRALLAGLGWAIEEGYDVINLSLSTTKHDLAPALHELADAAYFGGRLVVASAHNMPVESFPWRFASVVSVGSHGEADPETFFYNPSPPVEFFARGVDVEVAWTGGSTVRAGGNSFATPHVAGLCALIRSKHPWLTPFQVKSVLHQTASNATAAA
jgi:subtilisin family serine protease